MKDSFFGSMQEKDGQLVKGEGPRRTLYEELRKKPNILADGGF